MITMKKAFEVFFEKQKKAHQKFFGTNPTVTPTEDMDKSMIISPPDGEGYVEWVPKLQSQAVDWPAIEKDLGFVLGNEIKTYYSTYLFFQLDGELKDKRLFFRPIYNEHAIPALVKLQYDYSQYVFPNTQRFMLASTAIGQSDSFYVHYDNLTGQVFCYDSEIDKNIDLPGSLTEIIYTMDGCVG
ncbi:SecY-interacting protein Syd [Desulfococcaceae bacterium OttesenSCG-928-F15]|nr:SecY-interacting protein Syd [Desulfococcaceae bacterium OttesenSCG-928-F15]